MKELGGKPPQGQEGKNNEASEEEKEASKGKGKKDKNKKDDNFTMDIMMLLDTEKVHNLRKEFEKAEDGLSLHQFVSVMKSFLQGENDIDDNEVVANLCDLFAQIDINGDGNMEWDEFTSFIVETGMAASDHEPNSIQMYHRSKWEDTLKHHALIDKLFYWPSIDRIASVELGSTILNIYNHKLDPIKAITVPPSAGAILCADYIPKLNQYVISSSNLEMGFYDESSGRQLKKLTSPSSQMCLAYQESSLGLSAPILFSAGVSGVIHAWETDTCNLKFTMGGAGTFYYYLHAFFFPI
jgi:hypothetical protein